MADYQGKKIVIAGLGMTGLSCVDFFLARGITPRVTDSRNAPPGLDKLQAGVPCHTGELYLPWLLEADLIIASPGIALAHPALAAAADAGVAIIGDIELFCREATAPIAAISGSNGKSTVTCLLGAMAQEAGLNVAIGGNIGLPALQLLAADRQLYVLELSSFQLETTHSLHAAVACVLNVTDDHMDRYPQGFSQYRAAKLRIYHHAAVCVTNADDPATVPDMAFADAAFADGDFADAAFSEAIPHKTIANEIINHKRISPEISAATARRILRFGVHQGDYCLVRDDQGHCWLSAKGERLLDVRHLSLAGQHNYTNALAALALADTLHIPRAASLRALRAFRGLPHRFQLVREAAGVRWINDSKATNVGSTLAALQGLQVPGRLHLLLGGDGKSADFSPLKPCVQAENIHLYCYGRDRRQLAALRPDQAQQADTLQQAMQLLAGRLRAGDMVLLSPACASLDQFKNFEQRGEEFARLAQEIN